MNQQQRDYLLKNYQSRSVKALASELGLDRKDIQRELRKMLAARAGEVRPPAVARTEPRWAHILAVGAILVAILLIYGKSLSYPFLNWDDPQYVTENRLIRSFSRENLVEIFTRPHFSLYIPFTLLSYAADYQISHFNPLGYHVTNLALHLANAVLVYALVAFLTGEWLVAAGAALVFGVHPVQIESVVWVAERKNLLSSLFFLASFLSYAAAGPSRHGRPRPGWDAKWRLRSESRALFAVSLLLFLAACFSKPNVVMLPLLLAAYDRSSTPEGKISVRRYLPYVVTALFFALITFEITRGGGKMNYHGGTFGSTLLVMPVVMMKYLELLFLPLRQSLLYEFPVYGSLSDAPVFLAFAGLGLLGGSLFFLWRKAKPLFFWGAWYFILLMPVMNVIPFPSLMNDRYLYLPLVAAFTLIFWVLHRAAGKIACVVAIAIFVSVFVPLNLRRQEVWSHPERLWLETQKKIQERHQSPYINLGMHYLKANEIEKAIEQFETVLGLADDPKAYDGLGIAYFKKGEYEKSVQNFKKAIERAPDEASPRSNLAIVYREQGEFSEALAELQAVVRLEPKEPKYRNNLASLLMEMGEEELAEGELMATLKIDPDFADALYNLGLLYKMQGRREEARKYWDRLRAIHPDHEKVAEVNQESEVPGT